MLLSGAYGLGTGVRGLLGCVFRLGKAEAEDQEYNQKKQNPVQIIALGAEICPASVWVFTSILITTTIIAISSSRRTCLLCVRVKKISSFVSATLMFSICAPPIHWGVVVISVGWPRLLVLEGLWVRMFLLMITPW